MQMKKGVEQSISAILILNLLPDKAVLPGEAISEQLGTSVTYFRKLLRKLVCADLIMSVPGVKGGFRLNKKSEDIRIYDIYLAIEGQQSHFAPSDVLDDVLNLKEKGSCRLITEIMDEAETAWQSVLKNKTIAKLSEELQQERFAKEVEMLQQWVKEKMVL
ncbi:Rrf2 family transcriptional regulator [Viridibacillus sp. FSL E2-0187]|uniref:RrF2 family transcriptional regulator n=1 Tax=Viridibacillus TaxID=496496 RepID=UPI0030FC260D